MDDRLLFEATLFRHAARIADVSSRWLRGLSTDDKDALLSDAVELMWMQRKGFDPHRHDIGSWFAECLRSAAQLRKTWRVWRGGEYKWVRGKHLEEWR